MSNRKSQYKDLQKWRDVCYQQRKRYYKKTQHSVNHHKKWTEEEASMVLAHAISDTELSSILGRSVGSIQSKRSNLIKKQLLAQ